MCVGAYLWTFTASSTVPQIQTPSTIAAGFFRAANAHLALRTGPAVHTDALEPGTFLPLDTAERPRPGTRPRKTLIDVRLALTPGKTRRALAAEFPDVVAAFPAVAAWRRSALVEVGLAAGTGRSTWTRAAESADQVAARSAVEARLVGTLVHLVVAQRALKPGDAKTPEVADAVDAGGAVVARHRSAFVDGRLAVAAVVTEWTDALVRTSDVTACPTVDAAQTCTPKHQQPQNRGFSNPSNSSSYFIR